MTAAPLPDSVLEPLALALGLAVVAGVLGRGRLLALILRQATNASVARDHGSAVAWLRLASALGARDPGLRMERAWHLARLGRVEAALATYRRAARTLPPDVGDAEYAAAQTLAAAGRLDEAEAMLEAAVARDPTVRQDLRHDEDLAALLGGRARFEALRR